MEREYFNAIMEKLKEAVYIGIGYYLGKQPLQVLVETIEQMEKELARLDEEDYEDNKRPTPSLQ